MHEISYNQRGNLLLLDEMCDSLGFGAVVEAADVASRNTSVAELFSARGMAIGDFFNSLSSETLLELINVHEGVYGYLTAPSDKLTRLQELKWKL